MAPARLTTAVIGAGPAGLLFCAIGKLLAQKAGRADDWSVRLFDKRTTYVRTHRLRMDPAPYLAIQQDVNDPRFDALIAFLQEEGFTPEVNVLEEKLSALVRSLGIEREVRELDAAALQELQASGATIVGADSVHSTVRDWIRGPAQPDRRTHERVARLRVVGANLPAKLGVLDQLRLSKLLHSLLDYRLNRNGFAEVDLFLTDAEHAAVKPLGATPAAPVKLTPAMLSATRAPLFRAVVEHFERAGHEVMLQSTFELEHQLMPKVAFDGRVFLVGDAAVSLPFFRGMACLGACAHALARAHCEALTGADPVPHYEAAVAAIKAKEIAVVTSRARAIRVLRDVVRVSALLPFPIQSWFLSTREGEQPEDRATIGLFANVALALAAAAATGAAALRFQPLWLAAALPLQFLGGAAFRATVSFEPGPHRLVRRVWEFQIAAALISGVGLALQSLPSPLRVAAGVSLWFVLGLAFLGGLLTYERIVARWFARAGLD